MVISIGCDHAGYLYKAEIKAWLESEKHIVRDHGTDGPDSVDYPDFVHPVANDIADGSADMGLLICGTGNGVAITANKHLHIRCGLCWKPEIAELIRLHNDANIMAIPARFVDVELALEMVKVFISTEFEGGRHQRRVDKMDPDKDKMSNCC